MKYDQETILAALEAAHACVVAVEEEANGNRLITGESGAYVLDVLVDLLDDFSGKRKAAKA